MPDLRDIHQVGWPLVPVLRLQAADKTEEPEVQGKAARQDKEAERRQADSHTLKVNEQDWRWRAEQDLPRAG